MITGHTTIFKHFLGPHNRPPSTVWREKVELGQANCPGIRLLKGTIPAFDKPIPIEDPVSIKRPARTDAPLLAINSSPSRTLNAASAEAYACGENSWPLWSGFAHIL